MERKNNQTNFHRDLKKYMDDLTHKVYNVTERFPKTEIFGLTSQIRRAVLSIILNYIEGYARKRILVMRNFYEISYGSLKETKYLLYFSYTLGYIKKEDYDICLSLTESIGKMLWGILEKL